MDEERKILTQSVVVTIAAIAILAAGIGGYYWYSHRAEPAPLPAAAAPAPIAPAPAAPAPVASPYAHPIDESGADHSTALDQSDAPFLAALARIDGWHASVLHLLLPGNLIRHIVATVDALPRRRSRRRRTPSNRCQARWA